MEGQPERLLPISVEEVFARQQRADALLSVGEVVGGFGAPFGIFVGQQAVR